MTRRAICVRISDYAMKEYGPYWIADVLRNAGVDPDVVQTQILPRDVVTGERSYVLTDPHDRHPWFPEVGADGRIVTVGLAGLKRLYMAWLVPEGIS